MTEDEAIQKAAQRIVFPFDHKGFVTSYDKMLQAFRRMCRYDAHHLRSMSSETGGRKNRLISHRWRDYSRRYGVAIREITRGPYVSWTSGCGRLGVSMPADCVESIARGRSAAYPILNFADRIFVFFELPWTGDRRQARPILNALIRKDLRESGAWEDHELDDVGLNLVRLVWMAGCSLFEEQDD